MSRRFNLLVFDWDGTLMDSEARIVACMRAAGVDLGLAVPDDDKIRNIIGLSMQEAVITLFPGLDDRRVGQMTDRYRYYFLNKERTSLELFPGAEGVLRELAARGYLMAVATGKGRQGLDKVLNQTSLSGLFHATRCADETFSKPHPDMLLQIMDELDVEGDETLMIGDTEYDLEMANNARVHGLAVSYGVHAVERLLRHKPLGCLDDITEMIGWLDQSC